jgi:chitobiase/beta-hexosaminidase-like protein
MFCSTSGATIHYTLDGSTPTSASPTYPSGGFTISTKGSKTVKAIGTKSGMSDSAVTVANYTIN